MGHPRGAGDGDGRARRIRARHVGVSRVLHPRAGRLRDRVTRPPGPRTRARTYGTGDRRRSRARTRLAPSREGVARGVGALPPPAGQDSADECGHAAPS